MDMWRAEVTTSWSGEGTGEDGYIPALRLAYFTGVNWHEGQRVSDVTGQVNVRPVPNVYTVYIECTTDVLDLIEADNDYYVEWAEPIPEVV